MLAQLLSGHLTSSVNAVAVAAHSSLSCFQLLVIVPGTKRPQVNQRILLNSLVNSALIKTQEEKKINICKVKKDKIYREIKVIFMVL